MESHEFTVIYISGILRARLEGIIDDRQALAELIEKLLDAIPDLTFLDIYDVSRLSDIVDSLNELAESTSVDLSNELDRLVKTLYELCYSINVTLM
jgi:hypothetical protein